MSSLAPAASSLLEHRMMSALSPAERLRIGFDLGSTMLSAGIFLIAMLYEWFGAPSQRPLAELSKGFAALIVSIPVFISALRGVILGSTDDIIEQLVAIAVIAALVSGEFTAAVSVPLILNIGHFLEQRSALGAQAAIDGLKSLQGRSATLLTTTGERDVDPSHLSLDDVILVRPGDLLPVDGRIKKGLSTVDQSTITGESLPEEVGPGDQLFAGSVNLTGRLELVVTGVGGETALGRVLELLQAAEQSKTPAVRLVEQYAAYWVPTMLMISAILFFLTHDMTRVVTLMVVACPGAFVLAGPTAMIAALAASSRLGILVKNAKFLETLAEVDTVILDKTGTVTLGHLEVVSLLPIDGINESELIRCAAICASGSRHPVSRAILRAAIKANVEPFESPDSVDEVHGKGVIAIAASIPSMLGRSDWLNEYGIQTPQAPDHTGAVVWVAHNGQLIGSILLGDLPRPEAEQAVRQLRELGLDRVILLTGDRKRAAIQAAQALNIEDVIAEVLPEQKLDVVQAEKKSGRRVMMVGDGVNDALALASGDVGVAMGAIGSDVALKSADVALMTNDLTRLPLAIRLSRQTRNVMGQNLMIGAVSSVVMIGLAAFGVVSPIFGALLHNAGEVLVIMNSGRLLAFGKHHAINESDIGN